VDVSLANRRVLKRSAVTASFPTPPRTYRRCKRGCSHNNCDSESDGLGNQGPALSSTDEGDAEFRRLRIKRGWSLSKGDDQEAFWLAGPKSEIECQKDLDDEYRRGRNWRCWSFVSCSVVVSQSMKQPHSEASSGLSSPPPSHRKRQLWQFTCRRSWTFCDCWALHHYPRHGQTHKGSNFRISQSSQIHLITPITRGPVWHMFCGLSPSMSMWVNLISVYLSQLWCASRVWESASQLQGKLAPYASSHISPSNRVPRLFACRGLQTYRPLSQPTERKISCMYKRGINSWCEYLIGFARGPRVAIRDSDDERNSSDGARESRERCWLRLGSSTLVCRRKQRQ